MTTGIIRQGAWLYCTIGRCPLCGNPGAAIRNMFDDETCGSALALVRFGGSREVYREEGVMEKIGRHRCRSSLFIITFLNPFQHSTRLAPKNHR